MKTQSDEIFYSVLEPERNGSRIATIDLTHRKLDVAPDTNPCTTFADLVPGGARGCTEIEPGIWRADDDQAKPHCEWFA